jgi:hypothetical protein
MFRTFSWGISPTQRCEIIRRLFLVAEQTDFARIGFRLDEFDFAGLGVEHEMSVPAAADALGRGIRYTPSGRANRPLQDFTGSGPPGRLHELEIRRDEVRQRDADQCDRVRPIEPDHDVSPLLS